MKIYGKCVGTFIMLRASAVLHLFGLRQGILRHPYIQAYTYRSVAVVTRQRRIFQISNFVTYFISRG